MMRATIILALLLGASPAMADVAYRDTAVGEWTVYRTPKYCWMMKPFPDGTLLKYNWSSSENASYLHLSNKSWAWIKDDDLYYPSVSIGGWSSTVEFGGHKQREDGFYPISFFADDAIGFRNLIESGQLFSIVMDTRIDGEYSLRGSREALAELYLCERTLPKASDNP